MRYQIETSNENFPTRLYEEMENLVKEHSEKLGKLLKNYTKATNLEVYIKQEGDEIFKVRYLIDLATKSLIAKSESRSLMQGVAEAYEALRGNIKKQISLERKKHHQFKQAMQFEKFTAVSENLAELKEEEEKELFQSLLSKSLPVVKGYIRRKLKQLNKHRDMRIKAEKAQDLLDELYMRLYDTYKLHMSSKDDFYTWLYKETDRLLKEKLDGGAKDIEVSENVEQLRKKERKSMEENYSVEADGDLTMMEDMPDASYDYYQSAYEEFPYAFYPLSDNDEEEEKIINKLDDDLTEEELHDRIHQLLSKLPLIQQEIYDLYFLEDLSASQIAEIKDMKESEVVGAINNVREYLKETLVEEEEG